MERNKIHGIASVRDALKNLLEIKKMPEVDVVITDIGIDDQKLLELLARIRKQYEEAEKALQVADEWQVVNDETPENLACWYRHLSWNWWNLDNVEHFRWLCGEIKNKDYPLPIAVLVKEGQDPPPADYVPEKPI